MRTRIELLAVFLGILLMGIATLDRTLTGVVYATDCTSSCSDDTHACDGDTVQPKCHCYTQQTGRQYMDPVVRVSKSTGSIRTSTTKVTCTRVTPCVRDEQYQLDSHCDSGFTFKYGCHGNVATYCYDYSAGSSVPSEVDTCIGNGCGEG